MPCASSGSRSRAVLVIVTGCPCAASHSPVVRQVGRVGPVDGDHQRLAGGDHLGRQAVEEVVVPHLQGGQPDAQQLLLAGPALAVGSQHAAGHPGRAGHVGRGARARVQPSSAARRATDSPMTPPPMTAKVRPSDAYAISLLPTPA